MRRVLPALLALLVAASVAAAADYESLEKAFQADLAAKEPARRLRAFTIVRGATDVRVVDLVVGAADKLAAEEDEVRTAQAKAQDDLAKVLTEIEKLQVGFDRRLNPPTEKEMKAFNTKVGAIEKRRDEVYAKQRALAEDLVRARTMVAAATSALGAVVDGLGISVRADALARVEAAWMAGNATPGQRLRYVDALAGASGEAVDGRLRALALDESQDSRVRVAALNVRVARNAPGLLEDAVVLLRSASEPVQAAAIDGLRRLHTADAIEPLVEYLAREDIGRRREDAHRALRSLTGQTHGPFAQPWRDWWKGAKEGFALPKEPADVASLARPESGVTYHGISTFSEKILFVLDVSKSMEEPVDPKGRGPRAEEPKIAVAKRELLSAVAMLEPQKSFNLLFFGHTVIPWKQGMTKAVPVEKERAKAFVTELAPSGGTNIHDALETAFRMAGFAADQKHYPAMIDTVFFLTDGKPTAGKIQEPERILETVREWNKTARITIHCIGMGDHDPVFLERLAADNGGKYVKR